VFAIVDIETTGGNASSGSITEIAIILHDGNQVAGKFHTLVNPHIPIPRYITALTGITNDMVASAPSFEEVAPHIFNLLSGRVFVAHNVNFDYSFIRHQLLQSGFEWEAQKLCTVRLSRKIFPGHAGYSLGKICRALQIELKDRHRACGDAEATAELFSLLVANDSQGLLQQMLKKGSREAYLPIHLPVSDMEGLPHAPGVYYFYNEKQKVIYIGKAKDIRKRVTSHFSNNSTSRKKQELMRNVHRISYQLTGTEFTASVLESLEIRKHWPRYNTSQKTIEFGFGIFRYEDRQGRQRLGIDRLRKTGNPVSKHALLTDAHRVLWKMVKEYGLCPVYCFLQKEGPCDGYCGGACGEELHVEEYNLRVAKAVDSLKKELPTFAIVEQGRQEGEKTWLLMEEGHFYGFGFIPAHQEISNREQLRELLTPYAGNEFVKNFMVQYAHTNPSSIRVWN
jgi:DNA polymerase-3 subunit epsilon